MAPWELQAGMGLALRDPTGWAAWGLIKAYPELLHTKGDGGRLPLHYCCQFSTIAVVKVVLEAYQEGVHQPDDDGDFPLHLYCLQNEQDAAGEIFHLLLPHLAVTHLNYRGETASDMCTVAYRTSVQQPAPIIKLLSDSKEWSVVIADVCSRTS